MLTAGQIIAARGYAIGFAESYVKTMMPNLALDLEAIFRDMPEEVWRKVATMDDSQKVRWLTKVIHNTMLDVLLGPKSMGSVVPIEVAEGILSAKPDERKKAAQTAVRQIEAKGMAHTLTLQLERRFGNLPDEVRDEIGAADASQINRWALKMLDAPTLDAVISAADAD